MNMQEYEELFGKPEVMMTQEELIAKEKELTVQSRMEKLKKYTHLNIGKRVEVVHWTINLDELKNEIEEYVYKNNKLPYLFINSDTAEMFWQDKSKYPDPVLADINPNYIEGNLDVEDIMWHYGHYDYVHSEALKELEEENIKKLGVKYRGTLGEYDGCKVFLNNDLEYGEIEIR